MTMFMGGMLGVLGACLPYAIADVNDLAIETAVNVGPTICDPQTSVLDDRTQGLLCRHSFRPTADGGLPASFVLMARSRIDDTQPTNPHAPGEPGTVKTSRDGAGVKTGICHGSKGISGGGGDRDEELILTFDVPGMAANILIGLRDIEFSDDDPAIFVSSADATDYDYTILEAEIEAAFTSTGSKRGYVDFGAFTSLPEDLLIDAFKLRETAGHVYLFSVEVLGVCDDGLWCNGVETCDPDLGCQAGTPPDCDDGFNCTDDSCDEDNDRCAHTPVESRCDDENECTKDTCNPTDPGAHPETGCVNTNEPEDTACGDPSDTDCDNSDTCDDSGNCQDNNEPDDTVCTADEYSCTDDLCSDGVCTHIYVCPGRADCPFDPTCPDAAFRLAVLEEPSDLSCGDGQSECTTDPPRCESPLGCGDSFYVEIWVTKFSPDLDPNPPHDPGISCAYVDLVSHVAVGEVSIEYGATFNAGAAFEHGTFDGDGGVTDLGACNFGPGGVGVWPEWVLVARVELQQDHGEDMWFELTDPTSAEEQLATSVYGQGHADSVAYGDDCESTIWCRGHEYDTCDEDCNIGPGDLSCFAACWLLCPGDERYDDACCGLSCDNMNFVKCSDNDCVGPEDFSYFHTAWLKTCDDETIILSDMDGDGVDDACDIGRRSMDGLPPLATDEFLRSFGLEVPSKDWKGYQRGILREWQRLETRHRPAKQPLSERERPRKQRGR